MVTESYILVIHLYVNGLNAPTKTYRLAEWIQNKTPIYAVYNKPTWDPGIHTDWKWGAGKRDSMQMEIKRKRELQYSYEIK